MPEMCNAGKMWKSVQFVFTLLALTLPLPFTRTIRSFPTSTCSYDRFFYDPSTGTYTPDKFLDDLKSRYGGVDSILMWPTYTNIGSDDRNQFDYFRTMPGGLDGVRNVTLQLKARGVRVLWPYNPWDTGTQREDRSDEDTFAALLKQTGGDGFNGECRCAMPDWKCATRER